MGLHLVDRPNSCLRPARDFLRASTLYAAQWLIAPLHPPRNGLVFRLSCRVRTPPRYSPWLDTLFVAYTNTNDSGLPSSSQCNRVRSTRHGRLSSKGMGRSTLSISLTTRPPYFGAFYVFPERVVNPVTIEPQYLEEGDPYRTHMRRPVALH
jgi:hypothetical protein